MVMIGMLMAACSEPIRVSGHCDVVPQLTPDYAGVTIPWNIAPLSFGVEGMDKAAVIIAGEQDSICLTTRNGIFNPPTADWHQLLEQERGKTLRLTVCRPAADGGWEAMTPVALHVSADEIDPYLVYRRVTPGYGLWNRMGIYQRSLESYDEEALYENRYGRGNCVNCHSFCDGDPDRWQVHVRYRQAGTYVMDGKQQHKLELQDKSHGNPVYANWHPNGQLVAYSTNKTFFLIHTSHRNRWEVMDETSDVMVTDVTTGQSYRSPLTASAQSLETFPCFAADGSWLYFCTAELPADGDVVSNFDSLQYSLCRVAFDATTHSFGQRVDTLFNARVEGGSASFPRTSPDGRWLCFTRSAYGNFSICHRDADLWMIDLAAYDAHLAEQDNAEAPALGMAYPLQEANSDQVDSFHSWSRNSRWLVVSSKRDDGIYTRPYFTHIDEQGRAAKAFEMPVLDAPAAYDLQMDCYNLPEMVTGRISGQLQPYGNSTAAQGSGVN